MEKLGLKIKLIIDLLKTIDECIFLSNNDKKELFIRTKDGSNVKIFAK